MQIAIQKISDPKVIVIFALTLAMAAVSLASKLNTGDWFSFAS